MYNDYYLQQIDNKLSVNNTLLSEIQDKQDNINNNIVSFSNVYCIGITWLLLFVVAIFFYHYFHTIFKIRGAK